MDDISLGLDPDDLMDLEEPETYDLEDDDDDIPDDPSASPFQQFSSGPASNATSTASSPVASEDFPQPYNFSGKPLMVKRGRGRPRREGGKPTSRRGGGTGIPRVRRARPAGFSRCRGSRSVRQPDKMDFEFTYLGPSSMDDMSLLDGDSGFFFPEREKPPPLFEELPYAPEAWPGKVCAFCNLGERSQLGQGEMLRLSCPEGFTPQRSIGECSTIPQQLPDRDLGDRSPRGPVTARRNKNFSRSRSFMSNEHVDELTIIGHTDEPSVGVLYEPSGQFYVHRNCALWSHGVTRTENHALENVGPVVLKSSSHMCSFCNHYGASLICKSLGCPKAYHFPCATASGAFQDFNTLKVYCSNHLGEAVCSDAAVCNTCKNLGDVANLMYCSSCGTHYHGSCVGLAQLPGVRAGWQCRKCRICQVCRVIGDETKLMSCEQCDKVYHASCQRPIVTSIPKYGWKCRCCRVCGDCGSRTPGAGLSSRWHLHYTVCDSCYQQRNKGCCCPVCQRAYRSHGHREMVQCMSCRKFVHGTCDPEADLGTYQQKRELNPDYEYHCIICKNNSPGQLMGRPLTSKRSSTDDPGDLAVSQESLYDDMSEFDTGPSIEDPLRATGLGKGKPYASKIAKKKLGYPTGIPGRPKGGGFGKGIPGKQGFTKRQRLDFGRKRGSKTKIRGVFGVPGVGLSRPMPDGKNDEEPGVENRLVLCSAKDKFVLTQDICVMCGALGIDQEGCLISCVQCGQCYHPYCLNVKVTKIILQKGWRCLDCTVCEGCGQRNDESRLILCDDCDVSYHTYCMDPPLDYVPHGNWKCKWCASCRTCGSTDPGFNSTWMNGCTECGPCASLVACVSCNDPYSEGDLIIQCVQCERWLHGACDLIKTEQDAEKCAEEGYTCLLCRPRDVPPPHLIPTAVTLKPPTPTKSPEVRSHANFFVDGVCLSESGHSLIKSLSLEYHGTRKKRKKIPPVVHDKEAGIMATIESVVAGGSCSENSFEDTKIEMVDMKDEPQELYKEGMTWTKEDGPPPEGFTIFTMESGISVLRRKRQRNLQKLGIGGFVVRMRGFKTGQETDDIDTLPGQTTPTGTDSPMQIPTSSTGEGDKPKKKPIRRKPKSKLAETFPPYLQEAFFGKDLMDLPEVKKEVESGSSDEEKLGDRHPAIKLSPEEVLALQSAKQERTSLDSPMQPRKNLIDSIKAEKPILVKEEEDDASEELKDVLALPGDLLDTDLVNSIINEDDELTKNTELDALADDDGELAQTLGSSENSKDAKDELSDILGSNFSLESIPNMNSKDVEDIFKGVLTDESQESQLSQEASVFPSPSTQTSQIFSNTSPQLIQNPIPQMQVPIAPSRSNALPAVQHVSFPPSPYHSEYSNSPQFSPAFSEPPSPWVNINEGTEMDNAAVGVPSTYNQRSSEKMRADEGLGSGATISAVLYANMNHAEWKTEYPAWTDRYKQIIKKWRTLSQDQKAPYLQQARDNRSQLRMKKQQQSQTAKETSTTSPAAPTKPQSTAAPLGASLPSTVPTLVTQVQASSAALTTEVCTTAQRSAQPLTHASTCSVSLPSHSSQSLRCSTPTPPPQAPPRSPPTHQQFTVHGHFAGPGDRVGPAPNVTVNPNYQPNPCTDHAPLHPRSHSVAQQSSSSSSPSATDQQIRVLTPSEIMRTLPSLCQENYEPQQSDQEKLSQQQKTAREAEQERQWKQLQALRQHQAQQQQHVIHEQRVQAIARVQRTISDPATQFMQNSQPSPLQVQETSPGASPRQFIGIKSPPFAHPSPPSSNIRTPTSSQSPVHEFPQQKSQTLESEPFAESSGTNKFSKVGVSVGSETFGQLPAQTAPFVTVAGRPNIQTRPDQPEVTKQLRELLQRQHQQQQLKTFEAVQQKATRIWNPNDAANVEAPSGGGTAEDITFRQPLPPASTRPRGPLPMAVRPGSNIRLQQEPRLQGLDPRLRLILQQQPRLANPLQQQAQTGAIRFPLVAGGTRPATIEQYEQLMQRQAQLQARNTALAQAANAGMTVAQSAGSVVPKAAVSMPQPIPETNQALPDQEIPDNVTAELEKLEQETGTMAELQGVSEILGGLGDDDDELLAEMGADFNILEYADPELEALAGEKTNILDLDLEDDHLKQEKRREALQQQQRQQQQQQTAPSVPAQGTAAPPKKFEKPNNQEVAKPINPATTTVEDTPKPDTPSLTSPPINSVPQMQPPMPSEPLQSLTAPNLTVPESNPQQLAPHATQNLPPMSPVNPQMPETPVQPQQQTPQTQQLQQQSNLALTAQQIHQQMLHQVQQAAALGKPMPPGSKLQTPDGIVGIVLANNNVQLQIPPNFQQRLLLQLQNQKLQMRVGRNISRPTAPNLVQPPQAVPGQMRPRMTLPTPPPPPPPYPGPPPPYPGNLTSQQQQMGLRMGPGFHPHMGLIHPLALQSFPMHPHFNRRPLLLEEQPLLLEDLLEQEKREQEKQTHGILPGSDIHSRTGDPEPALMSDHDFERLKADVFSGAESAAPANSVGPVQQQWQPNRAVATNIPAQSTTEITTRVQMFNANLIPAPPLPPENIITEQDKQTQMVYEQWLHNQNNVLQQQLRFYETEVLKLRKSKKSLNSKQRQLRKSGNQLNEVDSNELQRISAEQAILQKHLESSRKQSRQHGMLIQEYRTKQQSQKPVNTQLSSPLGVPGSSPIHHPSASHSPLLSPQQSPMAHHNSPLSSPGPMIAHSPSHGPVAALLQSPGGSVSPMQPSPMQPSPRIGTPLSQEGSPGPVPSPSQVCPPPPTPRMTSPQHRRVVTSPVGYATDIRSAMTQMRFMRPTVDHNSLQRLRAQTPSSIQGFPQKVGAPSPLTSPPLNQMALAQQQLLQKQLHQQALLHQQQQQQQQSSEGNNQDANILHSQRVAQLIQQRNLNRQQQQQQPQGVIQQTILTPQQQQLLVSQQQKLALQLQARHNQQPSTPQSPMQPNSPSLHSQQTMSPHSMPSSPMPPKSPFNPPSSPVGRSSYQPPSSPMMHQYQTPSSPMTIHSPHSMRRPPSASSSPAMPERPTSVENPRTPYSVESHMHQDNGMTTGGGNPNNPLNPIPLPPPGFSYVKLGLRGGAPMWGGFGRGEKRVPTPPTSSSEDVPRNSSKKESHISKVSILKKKTTVPKSSPKLLASSSHEIGDEGSSTSPVTPPAGGLSRRIFSRQEQLHEVVDFDDDNSTLLSSEVSLSSAIPQNDDEIEIAETLSQNDIGEVLASPMEPDQISDDFLLFQENMLHMTGGVQYSDKEETEEEYANIVIRSPTTSDDEFILQGKANATKKYNILNITENSGSPEQTTEPEDDESTQPFEQSEVVIIDQSTKSPEEQISTKEDFEELIDEGSRKEKLKLDNKVIIEPPKPSTTVYNFPVATKTNPRPSNLGKISVFAPILQNVKPEQQQQLILTPTAKINTTNTGSKLTSIILTPNSVRSNILSVGPKLVTASQGITIVSATTSQIASILPGKFTVPVISASAVRQLPNVKVIDKPSTSISLAAADSSLPKKIFDDDSPDNANFEDEKKNVFEERIRNELPTKMPLFAKNVIKGERQKITILSDKRRTSHDVSESQKMQKSTVVIHHNPPELKMTAQVIQETPMQITATETVNTFDSNEDKSVVISIPSPTPSQEQMLDNIALQALEENRRREFETFEDVLNMIENMQQTETDNGGESQKPQSRSFEVSKERSTHMQMEVNVSSANKQTIPQLSPLSQPADLTTNMANASQQLRTLLSTIQTTAAVHTSNVETLVKSGSQKLINVSSTTINPPLVASRVIQQPERQISTVIVPNIVKQKTVVSVTKPPQSSASESPKVSNSEVTKKGSLTLTAMLQNQPAATPSTKPSADTITAASLLATPVSLSSRTSFSPALAQAQPNAIIAAANNCSVAISTSSSVISSPFRTITSTNLLHTQLTKARTKSLDDIKDLKPSEEIKAETVPESDVVTSIKQELSSCKYSSITTLSGQGIKGEDSNVLLKKLLQNTACASTQSPPPNTSTVTVSTPPSEPQKTTLASLLPPVIKSESPAVTTTSQTTRPILQRSLIRETSFVSSPIIQTSTASTAPSQQLHIDVKKCAPPSRSSSRDELLSPQTPRSSGSQDSSLQTPPLVVKKENLSLGSIEVKRELIDESSQHSEVSDQFKAELSAAQIKEEAEPGEITADKVMDKEELKKLKRRLYNQKRRQSQLLNKESNNKPNKRPRKNSKLDEDYDSYIDSVLSQLRHLPPMVVSEPALVRNYGIMPIFGSGDLSKIGTKDFDPRFGELVGSYGNASILDTPDYYGTKPFGDEEPIPEKAPASTQRGFYDQEFPLIRFDTDDDKKFDVFAREDTPDSVVSCSSSDCDPEDLADRYLGLKLVSDDEEEEEHKSRRSPVISVVKPIAIRLKPAGLFLKEMPAKSENKENVLKEMEQEKMRPESKPPTPTKDSENIKVTLTLTSSAAEDIVGVLRDLANILQIPPPTTYQIVDRTSSPGGQKLGMYRTKGKDGKEGAPIDIQSILNGAAKFCKHCDVVILNNLIRKKLSDLPFLAKDFELLSDGEELYFCSSSCYMQFALTHRSPSIPEEKAAAIIDHLSQKDRQNLKEHHPSAFDLFESKRSAAGRIASDIKIEDQRGSSFSPYFGSAFKQSLKFGLAKQQTLVKSHRNLAYKFWVPGCLQPGQKHKKLTDKELMEMLYQMGITVTPSKMPDDTRKCMFCQMIGDGVADGAARLLNFDVDKWVHLNCALWSDSVYETVNGALMNLENAVQQGLTTICVHCSKSGATIRCFKTRCSSVYHLSCAVRDNCVFFKNKTVFCMAHVPKNEKDNELTTLSVGRRVYVNRDENRQVAAVMHHSDTNNLLRVGSLIFLNVGQLMPHQLQNFHTPNFIYPIGYKIIRFYWSMRNLNKRCRYVCSIQDSCGRPEFRILVQEHGEEEVEFKDQSPKAAWTPILERISNIRRENLCLQMFPKYISGEDLFGLSEPAIVRVLESLPGIETLSDYKFKYGRNPLLELPLAINPTGAARTEPRLRHQTHWKRPHTQRTTGPSSRPMFGPSSSPSTPTSFGETVCPYSKQFVHSKSSQYKKMKQEWRNNVYLARSKIQGLGLYAARDLEKHTMVIEYIGEVIRTELSECREKQYEDKNRGIYMFRLDDDRVVDATLTGGLARYINHSCNPNCVAETVEIDRDLKIIIFAKRRIQRGEELAYDYKFDIEDDQNKISCMCGAPNCRKWMN